MPDQDKLAAIKRALIEKLNQDETDYDSVIELSSQIALSDPDYVRFSVDAGHISRLGRELVAREETAVSELVKNAYDADAAVVELMFENAYEPGGVLTIDDNGTGMTRDELINGFMRLSSREKMHNPMSATYLRRRAGRKGIGRFAAQRLGAKLTITTQTKSSTTALRVTIDWSRFVLEGDLNNIANRVEVIPKEKEHGTKLNIEGLVEGWSDSAVDRIYRCLVDLIQPYPLSKQDEKHKNDPGFEIIVYRSNGQSRKPVTNIESMVYDYALATINATVDAQGIGSWSAASSTLSMDEAGQITEDSLGMATPYKSLRNVYLRAYYYIYNSKDSNYLPRNQDSFIRNMAKQRGGIRLYRNGFRVSPYGDTNNDWLSLDASSARRLALPPHANINFFGLIEITDPEGELFEETASREGLLKNEAFDELVDFAYKALLAVIKRVASVRGRKVTAGQKDWNKEETSPSERMVETTERLIETAESIVSELPRQNHESDLDLIDQTHNLIKDVNEFKQAFAEAQEERAVLVQENAMLRILASLGLTIGEFTHEIKNIFPPIEIEIKHLVETYKPNDEAYEKLNRLTKHLGSLRAYTSYFDNAVSENAHREMRPQELGVVVRDFHQTVNSAANRYSIEIAPPAINGYDLFTCPMHNSEWVSILLNLFTNSKKAIRRAGTRGKILLKAGRVDSYVYVDFADDGDGIAPENKDRIFDAFFTTTASPCSIVGDQQDTSGTGLGLTIVKKIVTAYNGTVTLTNPPEGCNTCFRIMLPSASEQEIERYAN